MDIQSQFRIQTSRIILAQFNKMMSYEKGTLLGVDIEYLHRMRVASRRLRALIRDFEPLFGGQRYAWMEKQIRSITSQLGAARDLDVFEAFLIALPQLSGPADGSPENSPLQVSEELLQAARERQAAARNELALFFQQLRRQGVSAEIRRTFRGYARGPVNKTVLRAHMRGFARQVIQPRLQALEAYRRKRFTGASGPVELHRMRICAKKLRYSMEIFEVYYSQDFGEFIGEVRVLQDHAGRVHDMETHAQRIREWVQQGRLDAQTGARVLACCGRLREAALAEFRPLWRAFWRLNLPVRLHRYWSGAAAGIPG